MTSTELAALIRYKTKTNSTTFTDGDMLPLVNAFIGEIAAQIAEKNENYFAVPAPEDLVGDQREYALPTDILNNLVKVEAKFSASDSRFPLIPKKDYRGSETESEIVKQFTNVEGEAFYIIRRKAIFILSGTITAVTSGLRIWYIQFPATLSALNGSTDMSVDPSTTTAGFPRNFHELLARRVSMEYKERNSVKLSPTEKIYTSDLQVQLNAISNLDLGLEIIGELPAREDQFDYGYNL